MESINISTAEKYILENSSHLSSVTTPIKFVNDIIGHAVPFCEYEKRYMDMNVLKKKTQIDESIQNTKIAVSFPPVDPALENLEIPANHLDMCIYNFFMPSNIMNIIGLKNIGKTNLVFFLIAIQMGTIECPEFLKPKMNIDVGKIMLLDFETPVRRIKYLLKKYNLENELDKRFFLIPLQDESNSLGKDFDFKTEEGKDKLLRLIQEKKCRNLYLDNLLTALGTDGIGDAAIINDTQKFLDNLKKLHMTCVIVNHKLENQGDASQNRTVGKQTPVLIADNVINIFGEDEFKADKNLLPEIKNLIGEGYLIGMKFAVAKDAPKETKRTFWLYQQDDDSDYEIIAVTDNQGNRRTQEYVDINTHSSESPKMIMSSQKVPTDLTTFPGSDENEIHQTTAQAISEHDATFMPQSAELGENGPKAAHPVIEPSLTPKHERILKAVGELEATKQDTQFTFAQIADAIPDKGFAKATVKDLCLQLETMRKIRITRPEGGGNKAWYVELVK